MARRKQDDFDISLGDLLNPETIAKQEAAAQDQAALAHAAATSSAIIKNGTSAPTSTSAPISTTDATVANAASTISDNSGVSATSGASATSTKRQASAKSKTSSKSKTSPKSQDSAAAPAKRGRKVKEMPPFPYAIDPRYQVVCGMDEAGRGPLMGDVVAACVVLDHSNMIMGLNDSKKLSEQRRDELAEEIKEKAIAWGIGRSSAAEIDEINILKASFLAMKRAYEDMCARALEEYHEAGSRPPVAASTREKVTLATAAGGTSAPTMMPPSHTSALPPANFSEQPLENPLEQPTSAAHSSALPTSAAHPLAARGSGFGGLSPREQLLQRLVQYGVRMAMVDGNRVPPGLPMPVECVIKGDARVPEIAAASILAKTARDNDLYQLDALYPEYHFAKHKGYPTPEHLALLAKLPLLPFYRFSYSPVRHLMEERTQAQISQNQSAPSQNYQDPNYQEQNGAPYPAYTQEPVTDYAQDAGPDYAQDASPDYAQDSSSVYEQAPGQTYAQAPDPTYIPPLAPGYAPSGEHGYDQAPAPVYGQVPGQTYAQATGQAYAPAPAHDVAPAYWWIYLSFWWY